MLFFYLCVCLVNVYKLVFVIEKSRSEDRKKRIFYVFFEKKVKKICSIQKKVVTLHDFSCIVG